MAEERLPGEDEVEQALLDYFATMDRKDMDKTMSFVSASAVLDLRELEYIGKVFQGEEELRGFYSSFFPSISEMKHIPSNISVNVTEDEALVIVDSAFEATTMDGAKIGASTTAAMIWRKEAGAWKVVKAKVRVNR